MVPRVLVSFRQSRVIFLLPVPSGVPAFPALRQLEVVIK